jgi:hypothetical protein
MRRITRRTIGAATFLTLSSAIAVNHAAAGTNVFDPSFGSCTSDNCSSEQISGTVGGLAIANDNTLPWTVKIFAPANSCLRAEVISQTQDLEIVLVQPDGTVFRDDDGGVGLQPLVKVDGTSNRGWNTLQVSRFNGDALGADFTMLYGVYPRGNPNCAAPTTPRSVVARSNKSEESDNSAIDGEAFDPEAAPTVE